MGQPPTYTRQYNFNDFATTSPSTPLPGDKVDAELNAAKLTLDELNANIAKIQRDDGKLGNTVVHKDAFDAGALALMNTGSMTPRGSWSAGVSYAVSDLADFNNATYLATAAHTSASAFTTDLAASRWILLANAAISGTANSVDKFSGTGSQTAFTLTSSYASNTSVLVFVNGALRNPGDDYSISGTTLTFVTAPSVPSVSGNENVIAWGPSVVAQAASDAALASSSNASGFADESQSWASKVNGIVESTDYSSKAYAIGGTGVDAGSGSAKDWATKTGGTVGNTSEYSAKYWATQANVSTVVGAVSAINTVSGSITNVNNVGGSISNVNSLASALGTSTVFVVTVANSGGNKFHLDGVTAPTLSLFRGNTYTFDVSDGTNSGHPLVFKTSGGASYTTGITTTGTAGSAGATVTFTVASDAPAALLYSCSVHGDGMGNTIAISSSNLSTVASNIADVNTTATNIAAVNTVAGVASTMSAAATNATNAAASATAAANSAAAAAASFDTFDDRYLGSKSSEPSVDNDGNALVSGALFFDSAVGSMKVFDGGNWILATSAGAASLLDYEYTATAGQTTFSGADNNSASLSYSAGNLIVSLNGIILDNGSDYTATSGTSIVLASGAAVGDHLAVVAFKSFTVADAVPASTGGTFGGNVGVTGYLSATTAMTVENGNGTEGVQLRYNENGGEIALYGTSGSTKLLIDYLDNDNDGNGLARYLNLGAGNTGVQLGIANASNTGGISLTTGNNVNRLYLSNTGEFGVGSTASVGTAGQVLTSAGSGAAPSWVAASGGGEQEFTATGAVSNGDIVGLNGDGTISVMTRLAGSFVKINDDGFHYSASVAYDSTNNKIVYLYLDDGNNDYPMVAIGTVSGTSISFGTPVQVASTDGYIGPTRCIFDSNAGKFVAIYTVYGGSNSGSVKCKVGTVSGTSCSFGSEATVQSGNSSGEAEAYDACYDSGSNKIIFFYITGTKAYINVGDISGTSISWGSRVDVGPAQVRAPRVTYDSSANKVICTYLDATTTAYTYYYRVCTVSGTSISLGTQGTVANSTSGISNYSYIDIEYCSARNRLFVAGEFEIVGDVIYVGSLSGTTITFGTPITSPISFSGGGRITMVDCPDINGVVLQYNYYYNNTFLNLTCAAGTNNPQAFSPKQITGDATTGTSTYYYGSSLAYDTTANKVIFATINDTEDDNPTAVVYNPLVPDRWVGLAAEAISNGASGKVTIIGGINTGQSGLVAGVNYKVSNSSDTLTDTSGTVVGVATSASSIYLTKAEIL